MEPLTLFLTYIAKVFRKAIKVIKQVVNFNVHSCSETLEVCTHSFHQISAVTCFRFFQEFNITEINKHQVADSTKLRYHGLIFKQFANLRSIESYCFKFFTTTSRKCFGNVIKLAQFLSSAMTEFFIRHCFVCNGDKEMRSRFTSGLFMMFSFPATGCSCTDQPFFSQC